MMSRTSMMLIREKTGDGSHGLLLDLGEASSMKKRLINVDSQGLFELWLQKFVGGLERVVGEIAKEEHHEG